MRHLLLIFIVLGSVIILFSCQDEGALAPEMNQSDDELQSLAKKPAANLIGIMELDFTFGEWPEEPVWVGTIYFEDYSDHGRDGLFGMRFYHLSEFKEFSQASPFEEEFELYDLDDGTIYLRGPDVGVTTLANKPPDDVKYRMNGKIDVANEPFEEWLNRNVHMSGVITWQILNTPDGPVVAPATAPGTFRIN